MAIFKTSPSNASFASLCRWLDRGQVNVEDSTPSSYPLPLPSHPAKLIQSVCMLSKRSRNELRLLRGLGQLWAREIVLDNFKGSRDNSTINGHFGEKFRKTIFIELIKKNKEKMRTMESSCSWGLSWLSAAAITMTWTYPVQLSHLSCLHTTL